MLMWHTWCVAKNSSGIFCLFTTAHSSTFCSALVTFNLVPGLIQLLPFSKGINTMVRKSLEITAFIGYFTVTHFFDHPHTHPWCPQVLRVLANIIYKERQSCAHLAHLGLLPALYATLKMADREMVTLGMDVLFMLVVSDPKVRQFKTVSLVYAYLSIISPKFPLLFFFRWLKSLWGKTGFRFWKRFSTTVKRRSDKEQLTCWSATYCPSPRMSW